MYNTRFFFFGICNYKIEEKMDGTYNAVLKIVVFYYIAILCIINCRRHKLSIVLLLLIFIGLLLTMMMVCVAVFVLFLSSLF